jgi:hypothetical protein
MKAYSGKKLVEFYHDLRIYKIQITELALCAKELDGLPESYCQIKAAARASQICTIPALTNMLLSAEREENVDTRKMANMNIKNLNMVSKARPNRYNKIKHCAKFKRRGHTIETCWVLHPELKRQRIQNRNPPTNHTTITQSENSDGEYVGFHMTQDAKRHDEYLVDSGANVSMTNKKENLFDYQEFETPIAVTSSNGGKSPAFGSGKLKINARKPIIITNFLYVPTITKTLLATISFIERGFTIVIGKTMKIQDKSGSTNDHQGGAKRISLHTRQGPPT